MLPDAHTDFTFAVVGEEFGFIACIILMLLFVFVVMQFSKTDPAIAVFAQSFANTIAYSEDIGFLQDDFSALIEAIGAASDGRDVHIQIRQF